MPSVHFVLCTDTKGNIGTKNQLLFNVPLDIQRFRTLTQSPHTKAPYRHAVLMGRRTWDSLEERHRPLPNRVNLVLTRNDESARHIRAAGAYPFACTEDAITFLNSLSLRKIFVIGGAALYNDKWLQSKATVIHHTVVDDDASSRYDTTHLVSVDLSFLRSFETVEEWSAPSQCTYVDECSTTKQNRTLTFRTFQRRSSQSSQSKKQVADSSGGEHQYLQLLQRLIHSPARQTRNSITLSSFGERMLIDLSNGTVPLLTSKKMAWKTVIRELLWFVRGDTDNQKLNDEKVHIWDANASRAFLDSRGLTERAENDLGPVYGFQWRHFGATYTDCHADYTGQGVDQLEDARQQILTDPTSRRMVFTAWNPSDLNQMALPPCHLLGQWYVDDEHKLWLQVYQRSGDVFLGVPFNLFSYSVLVHMMAHLTHTKVGGLSYILGDAHIYENHLDVVREQLQRPTHKPPHFRVKETCEVESWNDFTLDSFELMNYTCESSLKAAMVA